MKSLQGIAGVVAGLALAGLFCVPALAQGVPASISSYNFGGVPGPRGVPPGITSPGFGQVGNGRGFGGPGSGRNSAYHGPVYAYPIYYGYPGVYDPYLGYSPEGSPAGPNDAAAVGDARHSDLLSLREYKDLLRDEIALEEARLRRQRAAADAAAEPHEPAPAPPSTPAPGPQPESVLIFADGHQAAVVNYAIVGDALFDLSTPAKPRKIALAELNVPATIKANEERGLDFQLPKLPPQ